MKPIVKQIQTSNTKKFGLLHFLLRMVAACCLPGPDLGDAKNLVFDEAGGRHAKPLQFRKVLLGTANW